MISNFKVEMLKNLVKNKLLYQCIIKGIRWYKANPVSRKKTNKVLLLFDKASIDRRLECLLVQLLFLGSYELCHSRTPGLTDYTHRLLFAAGSLVPLLMPTFLRLFSAQLKLLVHYCYCCLHRCLAPLFLWAPLPIPDVLRATRPNRKLWAPELPLAPRRSIFWPLLRGDPRLLPRCWRLLCPALSKRQLTYSYF